MLAAGHEPRIFDLGPSPYHALEAVEIFRGDVTDLAAVERGLAGCDAAIHLAAVADVDQMLADPAHGEHVNVRGTLNVLEAARRMEIERVVYCSTTWVYSDCEESEVGERTPIPPPRHIYTSTKLAAETYCRAYAELIGHWYRQVKTQVATGQLNVIQQTNGTTVTEYPWGQSGGFRLPAGVLALLAPYRMPNL